MAVAGKGGRPLGLPKTGGRKAGTPNRDTSELRSRLGAIGYDPLMELVRIAMDQKNAIEIRVKCHIEMAPYFHSKRKPTEISNDTTTEIHVSTQLDAPDNSSEAVPGQDSNNKFAAEAANGNLHNLGAPDNGGESSS